MKTIQSLVNLNVVVGIPDSFSEIPEDWREVVETVEFADLMKYGEYMPVGNVGTSL